MEIFVLEPNCLLPRGLCGFGRMPRSTETDKKTHSWCKVGFIYREGFGRGWKVAQGCDSEPRGYWHLLWEDPQAVCFLSCCSL